LASKPPEHSTWLKVKLHFGKQNTGTLHQVKSEASLWQAKHRTPPPG